ncbi:MAG: hypothetical protein MUE41_06630, partial [Gemmatimonadaceae bacterium]|nr:hypothetical protein [Gemmatimonadaceae bacterium]
GLRKGSAPDALKDFFNGGSKHAVALGDGPSGGSKEGGSRTVTYTLSLQRLSFIGAPQRFRATVTATIDGAGDGARVVRASVSGVQELK